MYIIKVSSRIKVLFNNKFNKNNINSISKKKPNIKFTFKIKYKIKS